MRSSRRTAGWRITEGPRGSAGPPGFPLGLWRHGRLSLGWHYALLALRLFPLCSGCPETQQQRWARARCHLPFPRNCSSWAGTKAPQAPLSTSSSWTTALGGRPARWFGEGWLLVVAWKVLPVSSSPGDQGPPQLQQLTIPKDHILLWGGAARSLPGRAPGAGLARSLPRVHSCFLLLPSPAWPGPCSPHSCK